MIFNSSKSTVSKITCQELSKINLKKLKKREISEFFVCLNSKNAKINRLSPSPEDKKSNQNVIARSKGIKKQSNYSKSFRSHHTKSKKSLSSIISSNVLVTIKENDFLPKNLAYLDNKEEWLSFLAIKGINFMREMYLHFGVDLANIDETIKVEPQYFLIKMIQFLKPFINPVQYAANIEGFFNDPKENFNLTSHFGINYQIEQIGKLHGQTETVIFEKIETCLMNFQKFLKEFFNLINEKNLPIEDELWNRWNKIDAAFKNIKKKENIEEKIQDFYDNFQLLLVKWEKAFMETINSKLASLIPKCLNYQMRGDLEEFTTKLAIVGRFPNSCKEINWEIVDYYEQCLKNQIANNENTSPKNTDSDIIEFLKMLNVLLANIEFSCEIKKDDNTTEVVQIKFPVYDKEYDLYTSEERSFFSHSSTKFDYQNTVLKIQNSIVISGEQQQKPLQEIVEEMKDIDKEIRKNEGNHSEYNLMLFLYDKSDSLAAKFKNEFKHKLKSYPVKKLMLIKSINLEIYSFRAPCVKCSSLFMGRNIELFLCLIQSIMNFFPEDPIAMNKKLYLNGNENLIQLKKKLIFTKLGDGKDFFQKYQNQNFESCFSVDYEDSKSYTGEKLFPKSIKIKEKEKLENFLQKPHTFFINDKENKNNKNNSKEPVFIDKLKKFCFKKNHPDSNMGMN